MKVLDVTWDDCDQSGDILIGGAAKNFIDGAYTHIRCEGEIMQCEIISSTVYIGEQAS